MKTSRIISLFIVLIFVMVALTYNSAQSQNGSSGEPFPGIPTITDERDGQVYPTVQIGDQCWMEQNLNIGKMIQKKEMQADNGIIEKYCYDNLEEYCDNFGGLYQWGEVISYSSNSKGICPKGWHIPSEAEWQELIQVLGGPKIAGSQIKSPDKNYWYYPDNVSAWTTSPIFYKSKRKKRRKQGHVDPNGSGFNARGAGYLDGSPRRFDGIRELVLFWTSSQSVFKLYYHNSLVNKYGQGKKVGASVRCLKD